MSANRYILFWILLLTVIPFKVMFAQEVAASDTVQSEQEIKYDSILVKAAKSFSDSSYDEAIALYKEAGELMPMETYPSKMIIYVEATSRDVAEKQKRADDLRRKALIQDALIKANKAILDKNWVGAKTLFNEILSLKPEKADEDFAKSKIQAIDLELQRIIARTPVKEEPKPVYVPKTKREARAWRKLQKRNAILAGAGKTTTQRPPQTVNSAPVATANNNQKSRISNAAPNTVAKVKYQVLNRFNEDFKDVSNVTWTTTSNYYKADFVQDEEKVEAFYDEGGTLLGTSRHVSTIELPREARKIFATKYSGYKIKEVIRYEGAEDAAYYISAQDDKEKVVFKLTGSKDVAVFSRASIGKTTAVVPDLNKGLPKEVSQNQSATQLQEKKPVVTTPPPAITQQQSKPTAETSAVVKNPTPSPSIPATQTTGNSLPAPNTAVTTPVVKEATPQQSTTRLPEKKVDTPATTTPSQQSASLAVTQQRPSGVPTAKNTATNSSPTNQTLQPPVVLPEKKAVDTTSRSQIQPKPTENVAPKNTATASSAVKQTVKQPVTSPGRKVADSAPATQIQQPPVKAPVEEKNTASTALPEIKPEPKLMGVKALHLSDSSDYIKLICQDISFIGSNVYTKVLVQNYSEYAEFATDTLLVFLKKNSGGIKRLDQRFISTFPVIPPLGEFVLVSLADAPDEIAPDDVFVIEMRNKLKKTKLTIEIPWGAYSKTKDF